MDGAGVASHPALHRACLEYPMTTDHLCAADAIAISRAQDGIVHVYGTRRVHEDLAASCDDWVQAAPGLREYWAADWRVHVRDVEG